ncbi:MAG TPA: radical SAM protein [Methanospirillum sp.]|nr:radical SAM protein [Methanospirillum sp.]
MEKPIHEYADMTIPPNGVALVPESVDVSLTGCCNLSCEYCCYADSMTTKKDLPGERWSDILKELGDIGVQRLCLSGGEVFVRSDIFTIIDDVIKNRMRYSLLSNGTLINKDTISAFQIGKRRLRLDTIQISIDGSCAEIHDLSRPPKSFERAINALRLLVQAHFPVTVRVTLNHHNINDLPQITALLIDDIGVQGFSTNEAEFMGTARCNGQNIVLSKDERKKAMRVLTDLNKQYGGRIGALAGPLAMAAAVEEIEKGIAAGETERAGRGTLCSCGGVFSKMAILHDGTMVPCNMLPTLVMGVAGMHPIQEAWRSSPAINAIRYRRFVPLNTLSDCSGCKYIGFCSGGCPASVISKTGRLIGTDPTGCYRSFYQEGKFS